MPKPVLYKTLVFNIQRQDIVVVALVVLVLVFVDVAVVVVVVVAAAVAFPSLPRSPFFKKLLSFS